MHHDTRAPEFRRAALAARGSLLGFAIIDIVNTSAAVGDDEHDITLVTHDSSDVPVALAVRALLDLLGRPAVVAGVLDALWLAGFLGAVAVTWWWAANRRPAALDQPVRRLRVYGISALVLNGLVAANQLLIRDEPRVLPQAWDTRWIAYPLWTAATVATVTAALLLRRHIATRPVSDA